jgi:hypothetical protein
MKENHPLAGKTVILNCKPCPDNLNGQQFEIEDYWENVAGKSWMDCNGNPACLKYAMRSAFAGLPMNNNVVYGKVGPFGHLIHESELGEMV